MTKANFSEFLRQCRESKGLSQKDVSNKLGYTSPQFISNWERGEADPPVKVLAKLAKIYGIADSQFLEAYIEAMNVRIRQEFKLAKKRS